MIREQIINDLKKALEKLGISGFEPILEHPGQAEHGDYASNVALATLSSSKFDSPIELAKAIMDAYPENDYLAKIEVAEPGFLNFWFKTDYLSQEISQVIGQGDDYGRLLTSGQRPKTKVMVEFAHPNTHKLFHIGHLRNISTGESIVRILEANGAEVVRANYQGDVGMHIAKCLWGLTGEKSSLKFLNDRTKKSTLILDDKIKILGDAYVAGAKAYGEDEKAKKEIEEINKKIYQKDSEITKLWQETRQWSLEYFERIYKRLDSHFDRYYFESEVAPPGKKNVLEGLKKGIFVESEGAIIFPGKKFGLHNRVFITSEGNPTYEAKDMGLGPLQFEEFNPDLIIHVVGPEQASYFQVVFEALAQLFPQTRAKEFHLIYGWVKLKTGKMASRTGQVVLAEWLLDQLKSELKTSYNINNEVAETAAVAAAKYSILKLSTKEELSFDIKESINLHGDSGPYLQYTYARCRSVLAKAPSYNTKAPIKLEIGNWKLEIEELALLRTLYKFPEIVEDAGRTYSPNLICSFLFELAQKYNLFYDKWPIIKAPSSKLQAQRLVLTQAVGQVIKNGLYLLGIKVLEKM